MWRILPSHLLTLYDVPRSGDRLVARAPPPSVALALDEPLELARQLKMLAANRVRTIIYVLRNELLLTESALRLAYRRVGIEFLTYTFGANALDQHAMARYRVTLEMHWRTCTGTLAIACHTGRHLGDLGAAYLVACARGVPCEARALIDELRAQSDDLEFLASVQLADELAAWLATSSSSYTAVEALGDEGKPV
jgi:hypothetical protein